MDQSFASVADNCVIDNLGRIASRRGFQAYTTNPEILTGPITAVKEFILEDGTKYLLCTGGSGIYIQDTGVAKDLTALTLPDGYVINDDNWKIVPFNDKCYFVQAGQAPLVFDPAVSTTAVAAWAELPPGAPGFPNEAHAAFGRLWLGAFDNNSAIIYWSGLLDGENWSSLGTGSLNTTEYWPAGFDEIVALGAHNNFMVLFGKRNILLYQTTPDVNNSISLVDTIEGLGCIARDSVVPTGVDYMFIDATGVRSLNRTIQEKSVPIGDISRNVRTEFQNALRLEPADDIRGVFHVEDNFYVCFLPSNPKTYVFDTWNPLPQGAARASVWTGVTIRCGERLESRETLFGGVGGLYRYTGSSDIRLDTENANAPVETAIPMNYMTHPMDFGAPSNLIFPKQVDVTVVGGLLGNLTLNWGYDYKNPNSSKTLTIGADALPTFWYDEPNGVPTPEPFGIGEYTDPPTNPDGITGYWTDGEAIRQLRYNIWGSGRNVRIGFTTNILGSRVSIQEVNIQALQGRIL
jgi:hypothetical protein